MAINFKANKVNLLVSSVLFVFLYHSPNVLDTPRINHASTVNSPYDKDTPNHTIMKYGKSALFLQFSTFNTKAMRSLETSATKLPAETA
jgi:hypothetical protein